MKNLKKILVIAGWLLAIIGVGAFAYHMLDSWLDAQTVADYRRMAELDKIIDEKRELAEEKFNAFSGAVADWRTVAKEYNELAKKHELGKEYNVPSVNNPF